MSKYILPVPFAMGPYGSDEGMVYKKIINVAGACENSGEHNSSNLLLENCIICEPVKFDILPNDKPEIAEYLDTASSMQDNLSQKIQEIYPNNNGIVVIGGDHTISIGTGLGLSKMLDLSEVGLIWIDAHGDINIPSTSQTKSITGFPVAINLGLGPKLLVDKFNGNFIKKVVQIGIRDLDILETPVQKQYVIQTHSVLDIEEKGMGKILAETLDTLKDCKYIWLSIDADVLDSIYFQPGETDLPITAGMTPRELLYLTSKVAQTGKLLVTEIVQLKETTNTTDLNVLFSRVAETALGLGGFRYGL